MANRTTVKSNIVTQNVPTVTNAIMTNMLNAELADNVRFREDVAVIQASAISAIVVDFAGKDRVDLTRTGGSLAISVTGIDDGETKYLLVTKTAGQAVSWVGITDITPVKANADALPLVLYELVRKGANYFVKAWVDTVSGEITALYTAINLINSKADYRMLLWGLVSDFGIFSATKYGGTLSMTATVIATGHYRVTHNRGNTSYYVFASCRPSYSAYDVLVSTIDYFANYFEIRTIKDGAAWQGVLNFEMKSNV